MTTHQLERRLATAAASTAARRSHPIPPAPPRPTRPTDNPEQPAFRTVELDEVPTGFRAYGRAIWPLGDDITDDRVLVEGTDRRSYAALNHYLRRDHRSAGDHHGPAGPRDLPAVTTGQVCFARAGDLVRVSTDPAVPGTTRSRC